ncbi:hypothetical protein GUJ93_ZPchr0011g27598 [Zizania palustris]|uniref:Uncharacterized protein n=1 Tax=Zizania palustris TaxID=103762 RepID=A0A8J6BQB8_ZIZPA|nr:hypothetical protein GUJ93_ZPchr0011g27598 [Zizania palustris]
MYFAEIQWFVEIRKQTREDSTNNHSETKWSSSCHFDDSAELSEELKLLESKLEEPFVLINDKDSRIVELDTLNHKQPSKPVLCNSELLSLQSDMDRLFMEKMEAETQCFILTRASQAWKPLTEDQAALLDTEKSLPEDHKHLKAKALLVTRARHSDAEGRKIVIEIMVTVGSGSSSGGAVIADVDPSSPSCGCVVGVMEYRSRAMKSGGEVVAAKRSSIEGFVERRRH